jgi:HSP20 family protein
MFLTRWQKPNLETAWPTFDRLFSLRNELDQLFEPFSDVAGSTNLLSGWTPAVDLYEDKDNFIVRAELPGMKKEDIEISLNAGALTISGERKSEAKFEEGDAYRAERFFGKFHRTLTLPKPVDGDKVKASYKDGVLNVTLPKTAEAKPKQIEVSVN